MKLKEQIQKAFPDMKEDSFDYYRTDLLIIYSKELYEWLIENFEFSSTIKVEVGNVMESSWYEKRFIEIPFQA